VPTWSATSAQFPNPYISTPLQFVIPLRAISLHLHSKLGWYTIDISMQWLEGYSLLNIKMVKMLITKRPCLSTTCLSRVGPRFDSYPVEFQIITTHSPQNDQNKIENLQLYVYLTLFKPT
jgi:hypothetical protein